MDYVVRLFKGLGKGSEKTAETTAEKAAEKATEAATAATAQAAETTAEKAAEATAQQLQNKPKNQKLIKKIPPQFMGGIFVTKPSFPNQAFSFSSLWKLLHSTQDTLFYSAFFQLFSCLHSDSF